MKKVRMTYIIITLLFIALLEIICLHNRQNNLIMPISACGNKDNIFVVGNSFDIREGDVLTSGIYFLDKESKRMILYEDLIFEDTTQFIKIVMSENNRLFSVVRKQSNAILYEIWEITDGIVQNQFDITSAIDEENNGEIQDFSVDGDGNFYIKEFFLDEVIVINEKGKEICRVKDNADNSTFESMTTGKDGYVYTLFCGNNNAGNGFKIISNRGKISTVVHYGNILPTEEIYSVMGTSSKYDLTIKGIYGVYGYNLKEEVAKNIAYLPYNEAEFTKSFFVDNKLYIFYIDVDDNRRYRIKSVNLAELDLLTGDFL